MSERMRRHLSPQGTRIGHVGSMPRRRSAPRPSAARDDGRVEIVSQTVDPDVNLEIVYDALASLLVGYYRRQSPPEAQTR